jgi:hypothetical protein
MLSAIENYFAVDVRDACQHISLFDIDLAEEPMLQRSTWGERTVSAADTSGSAAEPSDTFAARTCLED